MQPIIIVYHKTLSLPSTFFLLLHCVSATHGYGVWPPKQPHGHGHSTLPHYSSSSSFLSGWLWRQLHATMTMSMLALGTHDSTFSALGTARPCVSLAVCKNPHPQLPIPHSLNPVVTAIPTNNLEPKLGIHHNRGASDGSHWCRIRSSWRTNHL